MTIKTWPSAPEINSGVAEIDTGQLQLLQLIYRAHLLVDQGASTAELLRQAQDLIVCAASYFRQEKEVMQALEHPNLATVLTSQNNTLQNLLDQFNSCAFNREAIGNFILFLTNSLIAHVKTIDNNVTLTGKSLSHKIIAPLLGPEPLNSYHAVDIYIVDDEQQHIDLMIEMINIAGLSATGFTSAKLFIDHPIANTDIIFLDLSMPDLDGIEVMRTLYDKGSIPTYILVSGFDERVLHSARQFAEAKNIPVAKTLSKPINTQEFIHYISQLHIKTRLQLTKACVPQLQPANIQEQLSLEQLKIAIRENQLVLFYQPKLNMKTRQVTGFEALVRLQHPTLGLIFPDQFIAMAEQNNLISELTNEVFRLATDDYSLFRAAGVNPEISINISAQNLLDLSMPERFAKLADAKNIPTEMITIELTETAILKSVSDSLDILNRLRMKGFSLSIDDFGTGYSSLVQLYQAPFTELKIDQSFVMRMLDDDEALSIVKICILLAKELRLTSVAEGVESQQVWDKLEQLGCDLAQGYFISKPIPINDCCEWIKRESANKPLH